ncbi:MAG: hypothetical protein IJ315_08980 [Firmicutes bacterium]|nr:hypothetical protein [Bacillota bacterium]
MKIRIDFERYAPPGMKIGEGLTAFFIAYAGAIFISCFYFFNLGEELRSLYEWNGGERVLIQGRMMKDFVEILDYHLGGFVLVGLVLIEAVIYQYLYFNAHGSKSLYVMKRLPNKWELHKRCWSLPVAGMILCGITAFVLMLLFFWAYMASTPEVCRLPDQWGKIWRDFT